MKQIQLLVLLMSLVGPTCALSSEPVSVPFNWESERPANDDGQFGIERQVNITSDNHGEWSAEGGRYIWKIKIYSAGAKGLGLTYRARGFSEDAVAEVSSTDGYVRRVSLLDRGIIATVPGENLEILIRSLKKGRFEVDAVQGAYKSSPVFAGQAKSSNVAKAASDGCFQNYLCELERDFPRLDPMRRATVTMNMANLAACTGTLVNNAKGDGKPYVLTALHCDKQNIAGDQPINVTFIFLQEVSCGDNVKQVFPANRIEVTGGIVRSKANDVMLLEISGVIPSATDAYLMGVDATSSLPTSIFGASHPQSYSKTYFSLSSIQENQFSSVAWSAAVAKGRLEPGSSGSGAIDSSGLLRGVATAVINRGAECSTPDASVGINRLDDVWNKATNGTSRSFQSFLDPDATGSRTIPGREMFNRTSPGTTQTLSLSSSKASATTGESTTLSWNATGVSSCNAGGAWSGTKTTSGSEAVPVGASAGNVTWTLTCSGASGSISRSVTVAVSNSPTQPSQGAPSVSLTANRTSAAPGDTIGLSWSSQNATACAAIGNWSGARATSGTESILVGNTAGQLSYSLQCTGDGGADTKTVTVTVSAPATSGGTSGGGGGGLGWWLLAPLLAGASIRRRAAILQ